MPTKAILVDISDTLIKDGEKLPLTDAMIARLRALGLSVILISNDYYPDIFGVGQNNILSAGAVGGRKGTGKFVDFVSQNYGIPKNELLYLGDVNQDMWEATKGNVLFLRADWSKHKNKTKYGYPFLSQLRVVRAIESWFLKNNLWYFKLDGFDEIGRPLHYRSLLNPDKATITGVRRLLKEKIPNPNLEKYLTGHLLASITLEGLYLRDENGKTPILCLYPGHQGRQTGALDLFANISTQLFKTDFVPDLIIRHKPSIKSAYARYKGEKLTLKNQLSTILINPKHKDKIQNRRILVFDDFTTEGLGFETARNFLLNSGAAEVFCISAGKYGHETQIYSPTWGLDWNGFEPTSLSDSDFSQIILSGEFDVEALSHFNTDT